MSESEHKVEWLNAALLAAGTTVVRLVVENLGDKPILVGPRRHFFEVNSALHFERWKAYGLRLNLRAGNSVCFAPGEKLEVELVKFEGCLPVATWNQDELAPMAPATPTRTDQY